MDDIFGKIETALPQNMIRYLKEHDGTNIEISINSAGADYGYAHTIHRCVVLSRITRTCINCGYDQLWKPDDSESKCRRHTYGPWRYDPVFTWSPKDCDVSLEDAFEMFLGEQPDGEWEACVRKDFGKIGWR